MACSTWHTSPARCRAGLSASRASPSGLSVSNHPTASSDRFVTCPVSVAGFPLIAGLGFAFPSETRQSARPNRVRVTTDCPFAFRCSPHHLAMTQLRSATGRKQVFLKGTCTSLMLHACGRMHCSPYKQPMHRRDTPDEETANWRAVCGKTARTVRRAGRQYPPDPYRVRPGFIQGARRPERRNNRSTSGGAT